MKSFKKVLEEIVSESASEEDIIMDVVEQIKNHDYSRDLEMIKRNEKNIKKFTDGLFDVITSVYYINEDDFENSLHIFYSNILFLKYKLFKEKSKPDKNYNFGHVVGMNMILPILQYYDTHLIE